jgi:hypothetical protein
MIPLSLPWLGPGGIKTMETIIAGSQSVTDPDNVADAVRASEFPITEVISGGAPGVDTLGEQWAEHPGIPVVRFPADWKRYGRRAVSIKNQKVAQHGEGLDCCVGRSEPRDQEHHPVGAPACSAGVRLSRGPGE